MASIQFDMARFCADYGIDHTYKGKNVSVGWLGLQDPWKVGVDRNYHMGWQLKGNYLYSWSTGAHSLYSYLEEVCPSVPYHTLLEVYGDYVDTRARLETINRVNAKTLDYNFKPLGKVARKYLSGRGFDVEELEEKYMFRDGGVVGEWKFRIIIPVIVDGAVQTYQGRWYAGDTDLRYKTLAIEKSLVDPKSLLFNLNNCKRDFVVVVEGPLDAMKWGDNCCATLGTSVKEEQLRLLLPYKKVVLLFDSEIQAQKRAMKLANRLSSLGVKDVVVADLETEKDLGGMSYEEVEAIKKEILY